MTDGGLGIETLLAHSAWVRGLARELVLDASRADDVVQQTWLAALEHPPGEVRSVRGWLAGVVRNLVRQENRGAARRDTREQLAPRREPLPPAEEVVERADLHRRVVQAVFELGEPHRSTLLLRYYEDLPAEEIARRLGLPSSTVRSRIQAALEKLRERFDREAGDRRTWALSLAPLVHPLANASSSRIPVLSHPSPMSTGVSSMIVKSLVAFALVVGTGLGVSQVHRWWNGSSGGSSAATEVRSTAGTADGSTAIAAESGAVPVAASTAHASSAQRQEARQPNSSPSIRGRVLDLDGKPVAGVPVFIGGQPSPFPQERVEAGVRLEQRGVKDERTAQVRPGELHEEEIEEALGEFAAADVTFLKKLGAVLGKTVRTDAGGAYSVPLPAKTRVFVTVFPVQGVRKTASGAWHESPAAGVDFTVQRIPTAELALWLTDLATGKRVAGFGGTLFRGEERLFEWRTEGELLERTLEVPVASELFRAVIDAPAWVGATHEFHVAAGSRAEVEITVDSGTGLSGQVVDSLGRPVEGAFVYWGELLELRDGSLFECYQTKHVTGGTRSDLQGRFTLPGAAGRVSAWHPELSPASAPAQEASLLVLPPRGAVRGIVLDEQGRPAAGMDVLLDDVKRTVTDASGAFTIEGVEAGVHAVVHGRKVFTAVQVAPGETLDIPPLEIPRRPSILVTSGGAPFDQPTGGVIHGLDPVFSVSEWKLDGGRIHTGNVRPGRQILMSERGLMAVFDLVPERETTIELGTSSITLAAREPGDPAVYVLPVEASANPTASYWAARLFGKREGERLTFGPLPAGRYAILAQGRGAVAELDLADGEELVVPREQWLTAAR